MDFTTLAPGLHRAAGRRVAQARFSVQLSEHGRSRAFRSAPGRSYRRAGRPGLAGFHLSIRSSFSRLSVPLAYDGKRLAHSRIEGRRNGRKRRSGIIFSTRTNPIPNIECAHQFPPWIPTILKGVFGEGMDRFLNSCAFPAGRPRHRGDGHREPRSRPRRGTVTGKMTAGKFVYKTASFDSATSDFTFSRFEAQLCRISRCIGRRERAPVGSSTISRIAPLRSAQSCDAGQCFAEVAPIMGPKFTEYTKPYHFSRGRRWCTRMASSISRTRRRISRPICWCRWTRRRRWIWTLFHVPFSFDNPNGTLAFKNRRARCRDEAVRLSMTAA